MLNGTLLDDSELEALAKANAITAMPLADDALDGVNEGFRAYAALRSARPRDSSADLAPDHRTGFENVCAAVATAAEKLATDSSRRLAEAIPGLFRGKATGRAALRQYWVGLGFAPAVVDTYLGEAAKASPEALTQIALSIPSGKDWQEVVKVFGAGNPNPIEWGLGYNAAPDLHPSARAFAITCRGAGVTPSLYVITSMILLLQKLSAEMAETM